MTYDEWQRRMQNSPPPTQEQLLRAMNTPAASGRYFVLGLSELRALQDGESLSVRGFDKIGGASTLREALIPNTDGWRTVNRFVMIRTALIAVAAFLIGWAIG